MKTKTVNPFRNGDRVVVMAKDDFYAYIDGWCGVVVGFQSGCVDVMVEKEGLDMEFFVPPDQLVLTVGK